MDELWQRYRTFWTPVLIGLGIFLVGIIAVHVMTDDPEVLSRALSKKKAALKRKQAPSNAQIGAQRTLAERLEEQNKAWAARLDQTAGTTDVVELAVDQALRAAILRGASAKEAQSASTLAARFRGDETAAEIARKRFAAVRDDRIDLLRTADPNVGFSRIRAEIWKELRVRANRADVDLRADQLGFAAVSSVDAASLPQRLLNLALVARIVNTSIESGMESVDHVQLDRAVPGTGADFMNEWWVRFVVTGPMDSVKRVLAELTDPAAMVTLHDTKLRLPKGRSALGGKVTLECKAFSVRIDLDAKIDLADEEDV